MAIYPYKKELPALTSSPYKGARDARQHPP